MKLIIDDITLSKLTNLLEKSEVSSFSEIIDKILEPCDGITIGKLASWMQGEPPENHIIELNSEQLAIVQGIAMRSDMTLSEALKGAIDLYPLLLLGGEDEDEEE